MPVYTYTTLDDPLALAVGGPTGAWGINNTGQIVGLYRNFGGTHGFLYSSSRHRSALGAHVPQTRSGTPGCRTVSASDGFDRNTQARAMIVRMALSSTL